MATALGAQWRLIECQLTPDLIRSRLGVRARQSDLSEATWETHLRQREEFEPADDSGGDLHLVLDTSPSLSLTGRAATDWLRERDKAP
jgi:predicted kinase